MSDLPGRQLEEEIDHRHLQTPLVRLFQVQVDEVERVGRLLYTLRPRPQFLFPAVYSPYDGGTGVDPQGEDFVRCFPRSLGPLARLGAFPVDLRRST